MLRKENSNVNSMACKLLSQENPVRTHGMFILSRQRLLCRLSISYTGIEQEISGLFGGCWQFLEGK